MPNSARLTERITSLRGLLVRWERTKPVRELDKRLAAYRRVTGNGSTRRT